jgi:hypothetical protein
MAPHPPYSADLAPSDFFVSKHVKHALGGGEFPLEETVLAAIQSIVSDLTVDALRAVFANWAERLK